MLIADGLELLKSLGREKSRLEELAKQDSWQYRTFTTADAKLQPSFDLETNHKLVLAIDKKMRKLSRAINRTNNTTDVIGVTDEEYSEWL